VHKDKDENIKCKAYFGQSECVYFTLNETSNKHVFIQKKMGPMFYKYVSVYMKYLHYIYVI